ncbi:hypothetical protein MA47_10780 [Corynebacterium auriscanis]|uniref:Uncharacterized protein n=1 Tax=Corynebacterium auriscanis TaxID=99807 RepID=A0A0A2DFU0_9CORY|nr:hypothetical protein MA47_10780 [Corynebacterium auriscanis]
MCGLVRGRRELRWDAGGGWWVLRREMGGGRRVQRRDVAREHLPSTPPRCRPRAPRPELTDRRFGLRIRQKGER